METCIRPYSLQNGENSSSSEFYRLDLNVAKSDKSHSKLTIFIKQFVAVFNGVMEKK